MEGDDRQPASIGDVIEGVFKLCRKDLIDHGISLKKEPPIKEGTPDPYTPSN